MSLTESSCSVFLPDGRELSFDRQPTGLEVASRIGPGLAKSAVGFKIKNLSASSSSSIDEVLDLRLPVPDKSQIEIVTLKSPQAVEVIRHSAAHVMAQAVQELWPDVQVTIGPVIEDGFYYDFASPRAFTPEDLTRIEEKMTEIIRRDDEIVRSEMNIRDAIAFFESKGEKFKVEIIQDLQKQQGAKTVSVYRQGEWVDLCRGPHVQKTGQIKAHKVLSLAGSYWRGDEKRERLQRIYATAFTDKSELQAHLDRMEEAQKRDHRKLGKDLELFHFSNYAPGHPFFTAKGSVIYNELQSFLRELYHQFDYSEVITPQMFDVELFKRSGHYQNYQEDIYFSKVDERDFALKPMNCPGHCVLYASRRTSYRELPIRMADFGRLHRCERSGVMHGLNRVRSFCQDDAHIFCRLDQMAGEIEKFMQLLQKVYDTLGMTESRIKLATRPEKRMGSDEVWDRAESALAEGLKALHLPFEVTPGDGAFYGPKIEIHFIDAFRRSWQLGTIQCDFNLPEAFDLTYVGEDNKEHRPVMLHRAILGSLERFIGVYLEHVGGHFPLWLAPVQIEILPITDRQLPYAQELESKFKSQGFRVHIDSRSEKLNYKIREAQLQKVPYMMILGEAEEKNNSVSLRLRTGGVTKSGLAVEEAIQELRNEVRLRSMKSPFAAS